MVQGGKSAGMCPLVPDSLLPQSLRRSDEALQAAEKGFTRLMDALDLMEDLPVSPSSDLDIEGWQQRCYDAMNDDFNSPVLMGLKMDKKAKKKGGE